MPKVINNSLIKALSSYVHPLSGNKEDFDPLMDMIGNAKIVLLGEATHGTHEFYKKRAHITKRLIEEKGFNAVAVEADFPDAYNINRFIQNLGNFKNAADSLSGFKRFPLWMWRNTEVLEFITWLETHNNSIDMKENKVSFYGLDLYSLFSSMESVINYLEKVDPEAAKKAKYRYGCFEHFWEDEQAYGYSAGLGINKSCESEVLHQLVDLINKRYDYLNRDGFIAADEYFYAEQNARLVRNAEEYYRAMYMGGVETWNLRDTHMAETAAEIIKHLSKNGKDTKLVIWEHNSHIGDARATQMGRSGELNVGQLIREKYGKDTVLIGFTTYSGTVSAASAWDSPVERKWVRPAMEGSYEQAFHEIGIKDFMLNLRDNKAELGNVLPDMALERAIGVIYAPKTERASHYFYSKITDQFDAVIHFDQTSALKPLDITSGWEEGEIPETYPSGL
jgi:erythromycin esterase-like protein